MQAGPSGWGKNIKFGVYLVGAPRCGTTTLSRVLKRNPQVCFSNPKENHYFLLAPHNIPTVRAKRDYLRAYFPGLNDAHRVIIDGSVTYLSAPASIRRILTVDRAARFIVMVRNPIDMICSYHARLLYTMDEDEKDFERAWRMQGMREHGENVPRGCRDPRLLHYKSVASLGAQLEQLFEIAGRKCCHVIVFDDFLDDPLRVYKALLDFIEVDYDGQTDFKPRNSNRTYRSSFLQRIVMSPPAFVIRAIVRWRLNGKSRLNFVRRLRIHLKKTNQIIVQRPPLSQALRAELKAEFEPDIRKLSALLNRTFDQWI
jgi:hypothetical protein